MKNLFTFLICFSTFFLLSNATVGYQQWIDCSQSWYDIYCNSSVASINTEDCQASLDVINQNVPLLSECANFLNYVGSSIFQQNVNYGGYFIQCFNSTNMRSYVNGTSNTYFSEVYLSQYLDCSQDS
ncbi:hypothetical protein ABPG72_011648 [Tetrahymena utriculariae]